jgi:hypothetical protein
MKYALTALALAAMASSQASIIIDHFDDPAGGQSATIFSPGAAPTYLATGNVTGLTDVIGGARIVYVGTTSGQSRSRIQAGANVVPDYFTVANDSVTIDGYGGAIWNGGPTASGLNYDLSACKLIRWDYDNDQTTTYSFTLTTFGGASHTESVVLAASTFGTTSILLAPFALAGVNLADVDQIEMRADSDPGGDVAVHLIECDIPEPATTGVAFAALAGLGMIIRRFRKA